MVPLFHMQMLFALDTISTEDELLQELNVREVKSYALPNKSVSVFVTHHPHILLFVFCISLTG